MISTSPTMAADDFEEATGWALKPEGLCRGDACVPFAAANPAELDLAAVTERLGMPLLHDQTHGLWSVGPGVEPGGRFLRDARLPELTLPDLDGRPFSFSSLLGRKVVMVAWASW